MNILANIIRTRRNEFNLSKSDLSRLSGISRRTITEIEQGVTKKPKLETLVSLTDSLKLNIDDLIDIVDYSDDELDEFFSKMDEHRLLFEIVIRGNMTVYGNTEKEAMDRCTCEIATALNSVNGCSYKYDKLKENSEIELNIGYQGDKNEK